MRALVFIFLLLVPCMVFAQAKPEPTYWRTVTVSGEGMVKAEPDKADIQVTLLRENKELPPAKKEVDGLLAKLKEIAKAVGIAEKDLRTTATSVQPQYRYIENQKPELTGYQVSHSITLTLNNLTKLGELFDQLTKAGIDRIDQVTYGIQQEDGLKDEALKKALAQARRKAGLMADSLDEALGQAVSVQESGSSYQPPIPMGQMMLEGDAAVSKKRFAPPPAGEIEIRSQVNATFAITKKNSQPSDALVEQNDAN